MQTSDGRVSIVFPRRDMKNKCKTASVCYHITRRSISQMLPALVTAYTATLVFGIVNVYCLFTCWMKFMATVAAARKYQ